MDLHVFSILIPPPTSLSTQFLWVFPVHQAWAPVSCIQPRLVICFTLVNIHVSMIFSRNIPPLPSPRVQKSVLYICVSFSVFWCLWFLIHGLGLSSRFAIISHASKVFLKFCKPGFNSMWTMNFKMFKLDLEKAEEPEIKLSTSIGSLKKQEGSRKSSTSTLLTYAKTFDCVDHNKPWKIIKEMGIPDHVTCILRNLYAGQEATVRTGHGTTDWFQTGKGVHQACILSPCLFHLYAEYIMRNAGLEEA